MFERSFRFIVSFREQLSVTCQHQTAFQSFQSFQAKLAKTPLAALTLSLFVPLQNIFGRAVSPGRGQTPGAAGESSPTGKNQEAKNPSQDGEQLDECS